MYDGGTGNASGVARRWAPTRRPALWMICKALLSPVLVLLFSLLDRHQAQLSQQDEDHLHSGDIHRTGAQAITQFTGLAVQQ